LSGKRDCGGVLLRVVGIPLVSFHPLSRNRIKARHPTLLSMKKQPKQTKFDFLSEIPKSSKPRNKKKLINEIENQESEEQLELDLRCPENYEL
jgi:hypothetical protein